LGSGPDYANSVIDVSYEGDAKALLAALQQIEAAFQRERHIRWGARTLDLDIIAADQQVLPSPKTVQDWMSLPLELQSQTTPQELLLPHPRMHERAFVLIPMVEIAPDWRHPILGKTAREMCEGLPDYLTREVTPYETDTR
jgi:2-amino-4-hydroxy-6-hydroxymethyldihydropteridine diphosphokinase